MPAIAMGPFLPSITYLTGGTYRRDAWQISLGLEDLPPGFQASGGQGLPAPASGHGAAPSPPGQEFLQQEAHRLINGDSPAFAPRPGLASADGPLAIFGATDVFSTANGAAWDYGEMVRIISGHLSGTQPGAVLPIGDATAGLVGQLTLPDGRPATAYAIVVRAGNVAVGTTVYYAQGTGSFDLATALAGAVYRRLIAPPT